MNIDRLIEISKELGQDIVTRQLHLIHERLHQEDSELIIPFVGEFSSGKTTLINALTDTKALQTATKPTTATIYDIHFGCKCPNATITYQDGKTEDVDDISRLDNDVLGDVPFVTIRDTSTKISPTTVIVDTPGLSSPDPRHKQTLANFLPQADAIMLVSDVNQQITRSLTDFIHTMSLSKRPIYLVLSKCDTKSSSEVADAVDYIRNNNTNLAIEDIICVSAEKGDMDSLYNLFEKIQKQKKQIIGKVDEQRVIDLANHLLNVVDETIASSSKSDDEYDSMLVEQEDRKHRIQRKIDNIISGAEIDIEDAERDITRKFEDDISSKLEAIVMGSNKNFDQEAISAINTTSALMMNEFRNDIKHILATTLSKSGGDDCNFNAAMQLNFDNLSVSGINYNVDLNTAGHEFDSKISTGLKIAAAVGAIAVTAGYATGAIGAGEAASGTVAATGTTAATGIADASASSMATAALQTGAVIDMVDSATDVASIVSNRNTANRINRAMDYAERANDLINVIDERNAKYGQTVGASKGIVESMVGFVTERTMGKPQRRRTINNYMVSTLMPQFKNSMDQNKQSVVSLIQQAVLEDTSSMINSFNEKIKEIKEAQRNHVEEYNAKMQTLKTFRNELKNN